MSHQIRSFTPKAKLGALLALLTGLAVPLVRAGGKSLTAKNGYPPKKLTEAGGYPPKNVVAEDAKRGGYPPKNK